MSISVDREEGIDMPAPEGPDRPTEPDADRILECLAELHNLVRLPRIGWIMAGVKDAESIGDHCLEAAMIAFLLSPHVERQVGRKIDVGKVLTMLLFHEVGETRMSDMPRRGSRYLGDAKGAAEEAVAHDVLAGVAEELEEVVREFHDRKTTEAKLAEAAEELQILFAALMYAKEGVGDMTEYRRDVKSYDSYGFDLPASIAEAIAGKLNHYLGNKPYWELGYRTSE